ncbi:hypothetical protein [Streptomyces sp. CC219B]|uniref:hypothetical protein n=1 Tax=Streptomyces sp. CC219B TaxID=3044574 RepID=UPI0024A9952A|nr:hypothetical protein [Streptomyces sp. CC219B]
MPSLPPAIWAELFYDGAWNPITPDVRAAETVSVTRGLSSESARAAEPASGEITLDNRGRRYAPRDPSSVIYSRGRNTPIRYGYRVGSPWAEMDGGLTYNSLFVLDDPALDVTGDFDLRVEVALEDWSESQMVAVRYVTSGDQRSWALEILDGVPTFLWSPDGTLASRITQAATEAVKAFNGQRLALRVTLDIDNGAGGYELRFYTGRTVDDDEGEWSLLGDPVVGGSTTSVHAGSAYMEFGAGFDFNSTPGGASLNRLRGKAYALKLLDSGTVKVSMSTRAAAPGGTTFVDDTGLTWSRGGSAVLTNQHVRMSGEVPEWPATRDKSGNDAHITLTPSGVSRRMDAGNAPQDSALLRYLKVQGPIECWPLTDGAETSGGKSLNGSPDMVLDLDSGTAAPKWGQGTLADWIEPVVLLPSGSDGRLRGSTARAAAAATGWSVDFLYNGRQDLDVTIADFGDLTDADPRVGFTLDLTASTDQITLTSVSVGDTSSSAALQATITDAGIFDGRLHHIRLTTEVSGANSLFTVYVDGISRASGTAAGYAAEAVYFVRPGWFYSAITQDIPSIGYVTYWGADAPPAADVHDAATGFQGERAGARIERLAAEAGYTATVAGESVYQRPMGIQGRKKLLELLNEANATNFGYLLDARDRAETVHRSHSTLFNQHPALVIDFRAGLVDGYKWRDDDLLTENDVSVKREYGAVPSRQILEEGELSVQDYPDGVGRYDKAYTYSLYEDADAAQTAFMRLHLGTYNGVRVTKLTLNLANPRVHQMIDDILRTDVGDLIRLTNPPDELGPDDLDILVNGYTEQSDDQQWKITFVGVPGAPFNALTVGVEGRDRIDTAGCELAADLDDTQTSFDVTTTALYRWVDSATYPEDFPFVVKSGGEWMRVTACTESAADAFTRTETDTWGTADIGGSWTETGGAASDRSVNGTAGVITLQSGPATLRFQRITDDLTDCEVLVRLSVDQTATGNSMLPAILLRYTGTSDYYRARVHFGTGGSLFASVTRGTTAIGSTASLPYTYSAGQWFWARARITGQRVQLRVWPDGESEPYTWHKDETITTDPITSGQVGVSASAFDTNTNVNPQLRYDNFAVVNPQTFTAVRSVNGVRKTHEKGQDIRLAKPMYIPL